MVALVSTVAYLGLEARAVEVQCQVAPGLPKFHVVGLPDKAVNESRQRVQAALAAMGLSLPPKVITINLSPADLPKEGSHYDLPIALALLAAMGVTDAELLADYVARMRTEKEKVGSVVGEDPSFDGIPLVVLRKLARDGHFAHVLITHPIAKIARETIPYMSTKDRALQTANNHRVNPEVLRGLGRKRELFSSLPAMMALLCNPQTPIAVSMNYVSDLTLQDVESLLRRSTLHPELRIQLRAKYDAVTRAR